jgi:hypothetical protein
MITSAPYLAFLHSEEDLPEEDLLLLLLVSRPRKFQEWVVCSLFTLLSNAATTSGIPVYIVFALACIIPSVETSSLFFFFFFFLTTEEQNCLILGILTPSFEEETGGVKEREGIQRKKQRA